MYTRIPIYYPDKQLAKNIKNLKDKLFDYMVNNGLIIYNIYDDNRLSFDIAGKIEEIDLEDWSVIVDINEISLEELQEKNAVVSFVFWYKTTFGNDKEYECNSISYCALREAKHKNQSKQYYKELMKVSDK